MSYFATHLMGNSEPGLSVASFANLYAELATADEEHTDVSVTHESEWSLAAFRKGRIVLENVVDGDPCHMLGASQDDVLRLWRLLAAGDIDTIQKENWLDGYG